MEINLEKKKEILSQKGWVIVEDALDVESEQLSDWVDHISAKPGKEAKRLHRSGPNKTDLPRRAIYLTFNSAAEGDLRKKYYLERDQFLAKLQPQEKQISTIGHFEGEILN